MGDAVSGQIEAAVRALDDLDAGQAQQVIASDELINTRYGDIERDVLELIATQQPMATDLREILAISAIATDLERIADHAKGMAKITLRLQGETSFKLDPVIYRMAELGRELLAAMLDAFVKRDADAAREIASRDDEVDALYEQAYHRLIDTVGTNPEAIELASRQLWVAKSLERVADHITNMGERVVFVVTSEIVELNP
jgi:phosphate transport system protein